jgi:DNA polymerase III epsilon subunit-like protein
MNKIFIDTETTGLPIMIGYNRYHPYYQLEYYDKSRMIELGYIVYDSDNNKIKEFNKLIKPNNFEITNTEIHGITNDQAINEGISIVDALKELEQDLKYADTIIAHNINFDINIILSEASRAKCTKLVESLHKKVKKCTFKLAQSIYKKNFKLVNLYSHLFNKEIVQDHRALSDVKILVDCYYELLTKEELTNISSNTNDISSNTNDISNNKNDTSNI